MVTSRQVKTRGGEFTWPLPHKESTMPRNISWALIPGWLIILCLALAGCGGQGGGAMKAQQQVPRSTQSVEDGPAFGRGFKQVFPPTPALKERLQAMPQSSCS